MFKHLLIPLDFTAKNDPAIAIARQMAGSGRSRVTLLHVIEAIEGVADQEVEDFYKVLETRARRSLSRLRTDLAKHEIEAEFAIAFGKRSEEIVRFAEEAAADLIIMSSRRLVPDSPRQSWPTISHQVAVFAACPVLLAR